MNKLIKSLLKKEKVVTSNFEREIKIRSDVFVKIWRSVDSDKKNEHFSIRRTGGLGFDSVHVSATREQLKEIAHAILEVVYSE